MTNINYLVFLFPLLLLINTGCKSQSEAVSYLALGDSYTIGERVQQDQRWPVQLVQALQDSGIELSGPHIIAKTGWTTLDLRQAISKEKLNPPYELVTLLIGVNDQYGGLDFDKYPGRFEYLLKKAITLAGDKKDHVIVVSIPDYSVTPFGQSKNPSKISHELEEYNATNKSISDDYGVSYVNITPGSKKAADDQSLVASDGLHPSGKMYAQWVEEIMPVLLPKIKQWQNNQP